MLCPASPMRFTLLPLLCACLVFATPISGALAACDPSAEGCCCGEESDPSPEPAISAPCGCGCIHADPSPSPDREPDPKQHDSRTVEVPVSADREIRAPALDGARAIPTATPTLQATGPPLFARHCARLN